MDQDVPGHQFAPAFSFALDARVATFPAPVTYAAYRAVSSGTSVRVADAVDVSPRMRWVIVALFGGLLFLGGTGAGFPLTTATGLSVAVALLILALMLPDEAVRRRSRPRLAWALILGFLVLAILQLLPLPPAVWLELPGRELAAQTLTAAQIPIGWRSISLDPVSTTAALIDLVPALALLVIGCRAAAKLRLRLVAVFVAVALFSAALGMMQRLSPELDALFPLGRPSGGGPGIFVNRNHQASFLLLAIPCAAYWVMTSPAVSVARSYARQLIGWSVIVVLALAIVVTTSRAGVILLPLVLGAAALIMRERARLKVVLPALFLATLAIVAASQVPAVQGTLDRFSQDGDDRPFMAQNTAELAAEFWPIGSGLGTFVNLYPMAEPLDQLTESYVNNAHNDYVELLLEGGLASIVLLALLLITLGLGARRLLRSGVDVDLTRIAVASLAGLLVLLAHSVVDYPLRMASIMALAGLFTGFLLSPAPARSPSGAATAGGGDEGDAVRTTWVSRIPIMAAALLLLVPIWSTAMAERALDQGKPEEALRYNPWHPAALVIAGRQALDEREDAELAALYGRRALSIFPLEVSAAAVLIDALQAQKQVEQASRLTELTRKLGWREPHIQYRLAQQAAEREDYRNATRHADALLRTGNYLPLMQKFMRDMASIPEGTEPMTQALARDPSWRRPFLTSLGDLPAIDRALHGELLLRLQQTRSPPTPEEIDAFVSYLVAQDAFAEAREFERRIGRIEQAGNLLDARALAGLQAARGATYPFAWQEGGALGTVIAVDDGSSISVRSDRATAGVALRRLIAAQPGRWVVRSVVRENVPESWAPFRWSLTCRGSGETLLPTASSATSMQDQTVAFEATFEIPGAGCAAQMLQLNINSQDRVSGADIRILRLTGSNLGAE